MDRRTALKALSALPLLAACETKRVGVAPAPPKVAASTPAPAIEAPLEGRERTAHPSDPTKQIEWIWRRPAGPGPFPAILYVHGHQDGERPGAKEAVTFGMFDEFTKSGFAAFAISQPGYGQSDGPPDYCGPFTQDATRAVLREMRRLPFVDPRHIALEGGSRGAIVAGMVASHEPDLAALILIAGPYDLVSEIETLRARPAMRGIVNNIVTETNGASVDALKARSVMYVANAIKTPTLILNGADDDRTDPEAARRLAAELQLYGVEAKAVIFPKTGHHLHKLYVNDERAFLRAHLGSV